ncbi:hypothetical protein H6P81_016133 [Aristolochia fimbriata]|uniref:Cell cycle checkpoint control protein RAD9A n=1 Tax=Aristolochia fimbriata TaxID=158543 RepID=A0AAV7E7W4_ARIFI|nr:hypothetical protein H6P81_016133 [Aristolochia fimbriata]
MEFSLSGNSLKTFHRAVTCLARVGNELFIQASASQLGFQTLNSSRSAYQAITLKADFFDIFTMSEAEVQCSVLLKAVCCILRTPISSIDHLSVILPKADATKVHWTLHCYNGMKKSYWISCNAEPDIQHLSLDRTKFPSGFVVRPADLNRLLANFQSSLQEITIIATEPTAAPDSEVAIGGKAVELRSYIDPTKDNSDASLHTQLWIDPAEEFLQYKHRGDAVDVTFSVKELKAFITLCEGCEVDIHLFFEKAGEPILMAPKFGLDDGSNSDFDATLVLATMLTSLLHLGSTSEPPEAAAASSGQACNPPSLASAHATAGIGGPSPVSAVHSDHTRIWSDLSGSAAKSSAGLQERHSPSRYPGIDLREQDNLRRLTRMDISRGPLVADKAPHVTQRREEGGQLDDPQGRTGVENHQQSQHHPGNWVSAGDDDADDDEEIYVQSTP